MCKDPRGIVIIEPSKRFAMLNNEQRLRAAAHECFFFLKPGMGFETWMINNKYAVAKRLSSNTSSKN